jgi:putative two-component system response regulator
MQDNNQSIKNDFDETEEIEELVEISEEEVCFDKRSYGWSLFPDLNDNIQDDLLNRKDLRTWINRNKNSIIPSCLMDLDMNIQWTNLEYLKNLTFMKSPVNHCLPELFKLNNGLELSDELKSSLENPNLSYTWKGRIFPVEDKNCNTFLNVMIKPLIYDPDEIPMIYICCWDIITSDFKNMLQSTFLSLLEASKLKDNDTGDHIERVNKYSRLLSQKLKGNPYYPEIDDSFIEDISFLAAMHDVGKIGTPDDILNKGGPLDDWEREIMNEHTKNGAYILSTYPNPMAKEIALSHHEKWDGSGYPYGIMGDMIPLSARIVAIADVYDALRSKRSYKAHYSHKEARKLILRGKGSHFDPNLVDAFLFNEANFEEIYDNSKD